MAEVQDVFLASFDGYRGSHLVPLQAQKTAKAIMECRTGALGGHSDVCTDCGYSHQSYNSCRNRHCPKCQTVKKEQWIGRRKQDVLDVKHFHTVFTIPAQLNALVLQNPRKLYELLFRASSETVKELTKDPKYLGATVGFMSILHSWGSNMSFHPHIHMVVTAGGISPEGVFEYLGRYTHRLVLSTNRVLSVADGKTTFLWKDYSNDSRMKRTSLSNEEFIRRFLLHVLPHGFTRIRHYGLYSSRNKSLRLGLYHMALAARYRKKPRKRKDRQIETPFEIVARILGRDPRTCPRCGSLLNQQSLARASPT